MHKVNLFVSHPIQYYVPWFRELSKNTAIDLKVYYYYIPDEKQQGIGFGQAFKWDVPLLNGYSYDVLGLTRKICGKLWIDRPLDPTVFDCDVAILTGWKDIASLQLLWVFCQKKIPTIQRAEANNLKTQSILKRLYYGLFLNRYDAYLSIGKANRDFYLENNVDSKRLFDAPYFIENERIIRQSEGIEFEDICQIRKKWSIPQDGFCFVYSGKLEPKKRIMDLLSAVRILYLTSRKVHLLVVGDGELMAQAQNFVRKNNLPVTFSGFLNQTEITRAYAVSNCLVLPSNYGETWGLVVNEAMVCGLPAIVSDRVGCHQDLIWQGETGFTFKFGDINELASKMEFMANDKGNAKRMGQNAKKIIQKHTVEKTVQATLSAIELVLPPRFI